MSTFRSSRSVTVIFVLCLVITLSLFLLLRGSGALWGHWSISLVSVLLMELTGYGYALFLIGNSRRLPKTVPYYLGIGVMILLYGAAIILDIVLFWFILGIPVSAYLYIQVGTAAVAAIGLIVVTMMRKYTEDQEESTEYQTQLIKQLQSIVFSVKQDLAKLNRAELAELQGMVANLEESVKYSDPVGHPSLIQLEEDLLWQAGELQTNVKGFLHDEDGVLPTNLASGMVRDILNDLNKRNQKLHMLK